MTVHRWGDMTRRVASLVGSQPGPQARPASSLRSVRACRSMAAITFVVLAGATLPSPLYALWAKQYRFGPATVTVVFAVQAVCSIVTLLCLGRASDTRGRRPVLFAALGLLVASSVFFYSATGLVMLVVARALSGIAVGSAQGTAAAALLE